MGQTVVTEDVINNQKYLDEQGVRLIIDSLTAQLNNKADKSEIPPIYVLPQASSEILGGIKIGIGLTIDDNGVVSIDNVVRLEDLSPYATKQEVEDAKNALLMQDLHTNLNMGLVELTQAVAEDDFTFTEDSMLVRLWVNLINDNPTQYSINDVPHLRNLRDIVSIKIFGY